jgi:predicted MFS family arabinose efflux permease
MLNRASAAEHAADSAGYWTLPRRRYALALFSVIGMINLIDRQSVTILLEPIKRDFRVSDSVMGVLTGTVFGLVYVIAGLPLSRWSDRGVRRSILSLCLAFWSAMTALCGLAQSPAQLALARVGVSAG